MTVTSTAIGILGAPWRAAVTSWGAVALGERTVDWWVAADDRWHTPRHEASLRQRLVRGTPVVETVIRVPGGDAIHRAYAVADDAGLVVIEVENASALPIAVAFDRSDLLFARPPAPNEPSGIELPAGSVVLPVGHRSTVRVALTLTLDGRGQGLLPRGVPTAEQVARGWEAQSDRGVRIEGLDDERAIGLTGARCRLLLDGPAPPADRCGLLLGVAEVVRLGDEAAPWADDVVGAAVRVAKGAHRQRAVAWDVAAALDAAVEVLARAGEALGADDARRMAADAPDAGSVPDELPTEPGRRTAWVLRRLLRPSGAAVDLLPEPLPAWRGRNLAVYGAWAGGGELSFAVRWHGERPALLWEAPAGLTLRAPALDPTWSTTTHRGEALLTTGI